MKTRLLILTAIALFAIWCPKIASGATLLWTNAMPATATLNDLMPDGKGGVIICYTVGATSYARYIDKSGIHVWEKPFGSATECSADFMSKNEVILVVFQSGRYQAYQVNLKSGDQTTVASTSGVSYSVGQTVPTANKDAKGFFLVRRVIASGAVESIQRYLYK